MKPFYCLIFILFLVQNIFGQVSYGYIDLDTAYKSLPSYAIEMAKFETKKDEFIDSIRILEEHLDSLLQIARLDNSHSSESITKLGNDLEKAQEDLISYESYIQDEIKSIQKNMEGQLDQIFSQRLRQYCSEKEISYLFDKEALLYYHSGCTDFTEDFIAYLRE
ncbi:MAG: OmpH family outer membrane protein [Bacteroidota bacterium]